MNDEKILIPHLFRTEYRKIISVLCKHFGFEQVDIAEDIASDTFLTATQSWGIEGIPEKPVAWLYTVAKNKARNFQQRKAIFEGRISQEVRNNSENSVTSEIDLSPQNINDSQLQMMFAICHPAISAEAQIGLSLRILCGFGIEEIADAFLTNKDAINKRLHRAKEKLREEKVRVELPELDDLNSRLDNVLTTIYLLFNEGYYSASKEKAFRKDLCLEAMRLCTMLIENATTDLPQVSALLALMCFHASRFDARVDGKGELVLYDEQDESLWNTDLIGKGGFFMNRAAQGNVISKYHLEAGIAYWHTQKADTKEKWDSILQFYNRLLQIEYSPMAALNRTYALSKTKGKHEAIAEAVKLQLVDNHFYFLLLGELHRDLDNKKAKQYFLDALALAKTKTDQQATQKKIDDLKDF
jgi:RNA polymerase sigma factor (sigma-70 family)